MEYKSFYSASAPRIMLNLTAGLHDVPSVYESILFDRSFNRRTMCLQFYYMIYSPAEQILRLYQLMKLENFLPRLVWEVNETYTHTWKSTKVLIAGVSAYKVINFLVRCMYVNLGRFFVNFDAEDL